MKQEKTNQINNFLKGILLENPLMISLLGLCPALAITTSLENALGMGLAFSIVLILSNIVISLIRKIVPYEIRIPIYIVIIASFVTIIELVMQAYMNNLYESLGIFISLIVVNCIVLGRAEAFASKNNLIDSFIDAVGMGIGYTIALCIIASIREILGSGILTIWKDIKIDFNKLFSIDGKLSIFTSFFLSPAGAFIVLAFVIGIAQAIRSKKRGA